MNNPIVVIIFRLFIVQIFEIFHHVALCALCWCRGSFGLKVVQNQLYISNMVDVPKIKKKIHRMTWSIKIVVTDADCREKMTRWKHPGPAPLTNLRNLLIQTKKDNGLQVGTNQIQAVCSLIDMISIKCGWFCLIMVSAQVTSHHSRGWLLQIQ